MQKFRFRLQRVLDYRKLQEEWAKDAYIEAKAARLKAEADRAEIETRRALALKKEVNTLQERQSLETYVTKLEDDIEGQNTVIGILLDEEVKAHGEWLEARKNREALDKLRDAALEHWDKEADREETRELDEWTNTRRAA